MKAILGTFYHRDLPDGRRLTFKAKLSEPVPSGEAGSDTEWMCRIELTGSRFGVQLKGYGPDAYSSLTKVQDIAQKWFIKFLKNRTQTLKRKP